MLFRSQLQYLVGSNIRSIDGKHKGQITEPDIVIETDSYFIVFECKLGEFGKYPKHLWQESNNSNGPHVRKKDYFVNDLFIGEIGYNSNLYQLFRMAFYTYQIGDLLGKKPVFVSLTNKSWWYKENGDSPTPNSLWNTFKSQVDSQKIELKNVFWQDLKIQNNDILANYLSEHRCLNSNI